MKRQYRKYTDEDVITSAKKVKSLAGLLKSLDLKCAGGNYAHMKKTLQRLEVDCSHWTGSAWRKDQRLKDWSEYSQVASLKPHLIKERGHKCEKCGLSEWLGELIPLEVDHISGDRTDNQESNLTLLCCNCHALTPTWRGRKNKKEPVVYHCSKCEKEITSTSKSGLCVKCVKTTISADSRYRKVKNRPSKEQLLKEVEETNYCAVGRKYGVSDTCVKKWLR